MLKLANRQRKLAQTLIATVISVLLVISARNAPGIKKLLSFGTPSGSIAVNGLKLKRIAEPNEVIRGRRRKAKAEMEVELLIRRDFKSSAHV